MCGGVWLIVVVVDEGILVLICFVLLDFVDWYFGKIVFDVDLLDDYVWLLDFN